MSVDQFEEEKPKIQKSIAQEVSPKSPINSSSSGSNNRTSPNQGHVTSSSKSVVEQELQALEDELEEILRNEEAENEEI